MIVWNFKKVLKMRGIVKPLPWLRDLGISEKLAQKIATNNIDKISLHHLELLCDALRCTPHDFMEWKPRKKQEEDTYHPLRCLLADNSGANIVKFLKKFSLEEIRKFEEMIKKMRGKGGQGEGEDPIGQN